MHTNISTIVLFLAGTFGLMSGVFHFISMGAFWLYCANYHLMGPMVG
jgi:hypothetical protein